MAKFLAFGWEKVNGPAAGYPYEVHESGRVRHAETGRELSPYDGGPEGEYARVDLRAPGRPRMQVYVHQLVAWAFVPGNPTGKVVDHRDGDPRNNDAGNLRFLDDDENRLRGV